MKLTTLMKGAALLPSGLLLDSLGTIVGATGRGVAVAGEYLLKGGDALYRRAGSERSVLRERYVAELARRLVISSATFCGEEMTKTKWIFVIHETLSIDEIDNVALRNAELVAEAHAECAAQVEGLAKMALKAKKEELLGLRAFVGEPAAQEELNARAQARANEAGEDSPAETSETPIVAIPVPSPAL